MGGKHKLWSIGAGGGKTYRTDFNHSRKDQKEDHQVQMALRVVQKIAPPAIPPPAHPSAIPPLNKARGKHNVFSHFPKNPKREVRRRTKVSRTPCRRNPDDRAEIARLAEDFWRLDHSGSQDSQ